LAGSPTPAVDASATATAANELIHSSKGSANFRHHQLVIAGAAFSAKAYDEVSLLHDNLGVTIAFKATLLALSRVCVSLGAHIDIAFVVRVAIRRRPLVVLLYMDYEFRIDKHRLQVICIEFFAIILGQFK
jgi:hypothetical protein